MYVSLLLGPGLVGVVRGIDEDAASKTSEVKRLSDILRMATVDEDADDVTSIYGDVSPAYLTRLPKGLEDRRTSLSEPSRPTLTHFSLLACFFMLHNRIPRIVLALVDTCFLSSWIHNASVRQWCTGVTPPASRKAIWGQACRHHTAGTTFYLADFSSV